MSGQLVEYLGTFEYLRGKEVGRVDTFALQVSGQAGARAEQNARKRKWFSLDAALKKVQRAEVLEMLLTMLLTLEDALHTKKIRLTE